jgi:hypothetical protein
MQIGELRARVLLSGSEPSKSQEAPDRGGTTGIGRKAE